MKKSEHEPKPDGEEKQRDHAGTDRPVAHPRATPLSPGDEAAAGTVGSGEDVCPACKGSGKTAEGNACPNCNGTGKIVEGIGGG